MTTLTITVDMAAGTVTRARKSEPIAYYAYAATTVAASTGEVAAGISIGTDTGQEAMRLPYPLETTDPGMLDSLLTENGWRRIDSWQPDVFGPSCEVTPIPDAGDGHTVAVMVDVPVSDSRVAAALAAQWLREANDHMPDHCIDGWWLLKPSPLRVRHHRPGGGARRTHRNTAG